MNAKELPAGVYFEGVGVAGAFEGVGYGVAGGFVGVGYGVGILDGVGVAIEAVGVLVGPGYGVGVAGRPDGVGVG